MGMSWCSIDVRNGDYTTRLHSGLEQIIATTCLVTKQKRNLSGHHTVRQFFTKQRRNKRQTSGTSPRFFKELFTSNEQTCTPHGDLLFNGLWSLQFTDYLFFGMTFSLPLLSFHFGEGWTLLPFASLLQALLACRRLTFFSRMWLRSCRLSTIQNSGISSSSQHFGALDFFGLVPDVYQRLHLNLWSEFHLWAWLLLRLFSATVTIIFVEPEYI